MVFGGKKFQNSIKILYVKIFKKEKKNIKKKLLQSKKFYSKPKTKEKLSTIKIKNIKLYQKILPSNNYAIDF